MTVVESTKNSSDALAQGIITGDCECWCLEVTEAEYKSVMGEKDWKMEWEFIESRAKDYDDSDPEHAKRIREEVPTWRIYPDDLISKKFEGKYCRISVHVEFIKTAADGALDNITSIEDLNIHLYKRNHMPTPHYNRIKEFMTKAGQDCPANPIIPSGDIRVLRAKLILEEALETVKGLGIDVMIDRVDKEDATLTYMHLTSDDNKLVFKDKGEEHVDIEEVVDGCADVSVVTIGTLIAFGVDDDPILREVDDANLRKFGPGGYRSDGTDGNAEGKWIKPKDWTPPLIMDRLAQQGYVASEEPVKSTE